MDNQQVFNPQNQNKPETLPPQPAVPPLSPPSSVYAQSIVPTQPSLSPVQQPAPISITPQAAPAQPAEAFTPQSQMSQPMPMQNKSSKSPIKLLAIVALVIFVLLAGGYLLLTHNNKAAKLAAKAVVKTSQSSTGTTTSTTSDIAGEKSVPFGTTATDGTFQVKLLSTTLGPITTGDLADAGTKYLEADFSVTSIANKNNYAFGIIYLPSTVPAGDKMGNIELGPVDGSLPKSPLTFSSMKSKKVQITGKTSIEDNTIPIDGSAKTVQVYVLFEIKTGDKGEIVWKGLDNGTYHFLTQ